MYLIQDLGVILFLAVKVFFLHNINLFMLDDFEFSYKFSRSIYTKLHDFYVCLLVCHFFSFLCTFKPVSMVNRALTVMVKDRKCFCSYMYQKQSQIVNNFGHQIVIHKKPTSVCQFQYIFKRCLRLEVKLLLRISLHNYWERILP